MLQFTVEQKIHERGRREPKTRQFSAIGLGFITADMLWEGGQNATSEQRPVYLSVAGKESSLRPFLANLRSGQRVDMTGNTKRGWDVSGRKIKLMKKEGYMSFNQRVGDLTVTTFYLPPVWRHEPGMVDGDVCQFLSVPPLWWARRQANVIQRDPALVRRLRAHLWACGFAEGADNVLGAPDDLTLTAAEVVEYTVLAAHYMSSMDRRTKRPLVNDLTFAVQLYIAALAQGVASRPVEDYYSAGRRWDAHRWAQGFWIENGREMGFAPGAVTNVHQDRLDLFLTEQARIFNEASAKAERFTEADDGEN